MNETHDDSNSIEGSVNDRFAKEISELQQVSVLIEHNESVPVLSNFDRLYEASDICIKVIEGVPSIERVKVAEFTWLAKQSASVCLRDSD